MRSHTEGFLLTQKPPWCMFVSCSESSLQFRALVLPHLFTIHFFIPPPPPPFMYPGTQGQQAFRTEPRNLTVHTGATAVLKCEVLRASGTVQWVKDGLLLGPQQSLPGFPRYSMIGSPKRGKQTRNKVYGLSDINGPIQAEGMNLRKAGSSKVTQKSFIIDLPGLFIFTNIQKAQEKKAPFEQKSPFQLKRKKTTQVKLRPLSWRMSQKDFKRQTRTGKQH